MTVKKIFSSLFLALMIVILTATNVFACSYIVNAGSTADCDGYTVTANPNTPTEGNTIKWVPGTPSGTGIFSWGALESSHNWSVSVTWAKYTRTYTAGYDVYGSWLPGKCNGAADCQNEKIDQNTWHHRFITHVPEVFGQWVATTVTHTETQTGTANRPNSCKIAICHVAGLASDPANYVDLYIPWVAVFGNGGHFNENGTPQAGHENDSLGKCKPPVITNTATLVFENDCKKGYNVTANVSKDGVISGNISGSWVDPYSIEGPIPAGTVLVTWISGTPLTISLPYQAFSEPKECLVVLEHFAPITPKTDCKGWSSSIDPSDGGIAVPLTAVSGTWSDPFVQEDFTVSYEVTWPDGYKETFSKKIVEDASCVNEVTTADLQVSCGVVKVGSWMDITIVSPHATVFIEGYEIHGTQTITLDNNKAPFDYTAVADQGYLFSNGLAEINGVIEKLGHCYVNPIRKECPSCGPHKDEIPLKENNVIWAMGSQDCVPCLVGKNYGYEVFGSYTFANRDTPFMALVSVSEKTLKDAGVPYKIIELSKHKIKGVYIVAQPFEGLDKTYYQIILPRELTHNTLTFYEMDGTPLVDWGKNNQVD